jgi:hypothetical protein
MTPREVIETAPDDGLTPYERAKLKQDREHNDRVEKILSTNAGAGASRGVSMSVEESLWRERDAAQSAEGDKLHLRKFRAARTGSTSFASESFTTTCVIEVQIGEKGPNVGRVIRLSERDESAALQAAYESLLPSIESAIFEARRAGDAVREQTLKNSIMKPSGVHGQPGAKHVCCIEVSMPSLRESVGKWVKISEDGKVTGLPANWAVGEEVSEETVRVRADSAEWKTALALSESEAEAQRKANILSPAELAEKQARAAAAYTGIVR